MSFLSALVTTPTIGWPEALRLAVAAALGASIGLERHLRDREAGSRMHLLVCVGSALFTLVGVTLGPLRGVAYRIILRYRPALDRLLGVAEIDGVLEVPWTD